MVNVCHHILAGCSLTFSHHLDMNYMLAPEDSLQQRFDLRLDTWQQLGSATINVSKDPKTHGYKANFIDRQFLFHSIFILLLVTCFSLRLRKIENKRGLQPKQKLQFICRCGITMSLKNIHMFQFHKYGNPKQIPELQLLLKIIT